MKMPIRHFIITAIIIPVCSCSVIEKSSMHGFESEYYKFSSRDEGVKEVYADLSDDKINVYEATDKKLGDLIISIPFSSNENLPDTAIKFTERSLDVDLTTILIKFRPSVYGLPSQLNTDFNVALYAGWRHDAYYIRTTRDPLGNYKNRIVNRAYDFGIFAGPGTTLISPFNTLHVFSDEYNGFILQAGLAGFLESNIASFGIATGFDYLLNKDRKIWIYNNKPWVGFIIGIALN
jgi:hypothetical protein